MNFFDLCKMVLEQMLAIVLVRIKMAKLKATLREANGAPRDPVKQARKVKTLKTVAFLIARVADQIDVIAAPSNDPRISAKLRQASAQTGALEVVETLLAAISDYLANEPLPTQKSFLSLDKAEECLRRVSDFGEQHHFESRKAQQRLNLNFVYSFVQAKYSSSLNPSFNLTLYQHTFMGYRRSLEIAQANKNINGVLEAYR